MSNETIIDRLKQYQEGDIEKSFTRNNMLNYENEYIKLVCIDASNKWQGVPHHSDLSKQWGIIIELKKYFANLDRYKQLQKNFNIDITPVAKGINNGCYGIRFYDMKKNPSISIVKELLDYIFN